MPSCYYQINDIIKGMVILQVLQDYSYLVQPYENSFRFEFFIRVVDSFHYETKFIWP
jgi:hypothetical protein